MTTFMLMDTKELCYNDINDVRLNLGRGHSYPSVDRVLRAASEMIYLREKMGDNYIERVKDMEARFYVFIMKYDYLTSILKPLIKAREKATEGDWGLTSEDVGFSVRGGKDYSSEHICEMNHYRDDRINERRPNAEFIALTANAIVRIKAVLG